MQAAVQILQQRRILVETPFRHSKLISSARKPLIVYLSEAASISLRPALPLRLAGRCYRPETRFPCAQTFRRIPNSHPTNPHPRAAANWSATGWRTISNACAMFHFSRQVLS
jgi:hypothetical protein